MTSALLVRKLDDLPNWLRAGGAVSVGNFDGVHRGHARIVQRLVQRARQLDGPVVVFSFQPHPANVLRPEAAPTPLVWPERKAELLGRLGVDALIAYPTDSEILALPAKDFFQRVLVEQLATRALVEGPNFRFGRQRAGTIELLGQLCRKNGVTLDIVEPLLVGGEYVSSSRIRRLIQAGKLRDANQLLTAPHRIRGKVVVGARRGRTLGFPTANLDVGDLLVPPAGVYAGRAIIDAGTYTAAVHVGTNPTFGEAVPKIEVHLLDFDGDLYGTWLEVELLDHIRGIRPFENGAALIRQLQKDMETVRLVAERDTASSSKQ